jgi:CubicO group peptidase (beta-lactamase class C family)
MEIKKMQKIENLFIKALNDRIFSCAAVAFSKRINNSYERFMEYYGFAQLEPLQKRLQANYLFDLASLSKVLSTVPVLLSLFEKGELKPETRLEVIFSDCPEDKRKITIKQLMSHSSGFVPHREYFNELISIPKNNRKAYLLKQILKEKLISNKSDNYCYSDLGFILLGFIIEKITGKSIDKICSNSIYTPMKLQEHLKFLNISPKHSNTYVNTGKCLWSKKQLSGIVHDDNCRALGGAAGHAGLFGTLPGVLSFCEQLLDQWKGRAHHKAYSNKLLQETLKRVKDSTWTMGFDMVSEEGSSAGKYFSNKSVGHLGFTGTSFWIDPEKECIVILLTNRVCYGFDNWKIRQFRPVLHDLLMG